LGAVSEKQEQEKRIIGQRTTESLLWFTIFPFALQLVRFVNSILLARLLSPSDFGIIGIASVIVFYCNNLSNFGLGNAIVQRKEIRPEHLNTFFAFNLSISMLLCLAFILGAQSIASFFNIPELAEVMRVFSLMFIITALHTMGYTKLRRELAFRQLALNEATKTVLAIAISLPLALAGFQYWSMLLALLASSMIATITISLRARLLPRFAVNRDALKDLLGFASWNFFSLQIRLLGEYLDKLIVGKVLGVAPLGFYEKAFGLAQMPYENIANKISTVAFSTFSQCQSGMEEVQHYFFRTFTAAAFLLFPLYIGLFTVADTFVLVLLGEKWQAMIPSFRILLLAFLLASLGSIFSTINVTCGSHRQDSKLRLYCLVFLVPALLLAVRHGVEAVSVVVLIHNALFLCSSMLLARASYALPVLRLARGILPALAGAGLMAVAIFILKKYLLGSDSPISLLACVVMGGCLYGLWFWYGDFASWSFIKEKVYFYLSRTRKVGG